MQLTKRLIWIVLLKVAALTVLWWAFIRDQTVTVDAEAMSYVIQRTTNGEAQRDQ